MRRRDFLRFGAAFAATGVVGSSLWQEALAALASDGPGPYGPLQAPDANGLKLPAGFTSRVVARSGEPVAGTGYAWHIFPDGGAVFRDRLGGNGGWIYVSNSEWFHFTIPPGGVSAIRFGPTGDILDAYSILTGTKFNCAGGATPWDTWLSCEEWPTGRVWECDPTGVAPAVVRPAMGTFQHEAVATDPEFRRHYLTEDRRDGRLYRFTPAVWGDLSAGLLEVARVDAANQVTWIEVPEPNPPTGATETRHQVSDSTPFDGGEGIVWHEGHVYFTTKGDDRVHDYHPASETLVTLYEPGVGAQQLDGVDNITAARSGDLYVAEDHGGGQQELILIAPDGVVSPFLELTGADQDNSEITGPAFDPGGRRLYFSSQRGGGSLTGLTYEVTGPFRQFVGGGGSCAGPVG